MPCELNSFLTFRNDSSFLLSVARFAQSRGMNWSAGIGGAVGGALGGALGLVARPGLFQRLGSALPELNMGAFAVNALVGLILSLWLTLNGNNPFPNIVHPPFGFELYDDPGNCWIL
jgi:hypothetical protein